MRVMSKRAGVRVDKQRHKQPLALAAKSGTLLTDHNPELQPLLGGLRARRRVHWCVLMRGQSSCFHRSLLYFLRCDPSLYNRGINGD